MFALLGEKFDVFCPQIRIPCKQLYIWSNVGQKWPKSSQINKQMKVFINLNLGLIGPFTGQQKEALLVGRSF